MRKIRKLETVFYGVLIAFGLFSFWHVFFGINANPNKYKLTPKYYWHYDNEKFEEINMVARGFYDSITNKPAVLAGIVQENEVRQIDSIIVYNFDRPYLIEQGRQNLIISTPRVNNQISGNPSNQKTTLNFYLDLSKAQGQNIYGLTFRHSFTITSGLKDSDNQIHYTVKDHLNVGYINNLPITECLETGNWNIMIGGQTEGLEQNAFIFNPCKREFVFSLTTESLKLFEQGQSGEKLSEAINRFFGSDSGPADNLLRFFWACNVFSIIDSGSYDSLDTHLAELHKGLSGKRTELNNMVKNSHNKYLRAMGRNFFLHCLLLGIIVFSLSRSVYYYRRLILDIKLLIAISRVKKTSEAKAKNEARIAELRRQKEEMIRQHEAGQVKALKQAEEAAKAQQEAAKAEELARQRKADLQKYLGMDLKSYTADRFVPADKRQELHQAWSDLSEINPEQEMLTATEDLRILNHFVSLLLSADQIIQAKFRQCRAVQTRIEKIFALDPIFLARLTAETKNRLRQITEELNDPDLTPRRLRQLDHEVDEVLKKNKLSIA